MKVALFLGLAFALFSRSHSLPCIAPAGFYRDLVAFVTIVSDWKGANVFNSNTPEMSAQAFLLTENIRQYAEYMGLTRENRAALKKALQALMYEEQPDDLDDTQWKLAHRVIQHLVGGKFSIA